MSLAYTITLYLYNITLIPIIFFSVLYLLLCLINLFVNTKKERTYKPLAELPFISVQIPSYNDPIAERCILKCMDFDYPKNKY